MGEARRFLAFRHRRFIYFSLSAQTSSTGDRWPARQTGEQKRFITRLSPDDDDILGRDIKRFERGATRRWGRGGVSLLLII